MEIARGDIIIGSLPGDFGKPRPMLVVQDDAFQGMSSLTVLPLTSDLRTASSIRITLEPSEQTGLRERSQIMIDKTGTLLRTRIGQRIGRVDPNMMQTVGRALRDFLGLGDF
ncbi:MAG TPA: type II toxin-antitoxin system PemK/MazF family toxin [Stellaceae bacterium]|nr:type II toxin-antitoxin system PemK/MazF family toxin [Stellaceae bacterium]